MIRTLLILLLPISVLSQDDLFCGSRYNYSGEPGYDEYHTFNVTPGTEANIVFSTRTIIDCLELIYGANRIEICLGANAVVDPIVDFGYTQKTAILGPVVYDEYSRKFNPINLDSVELFGLQEQDLAQGIAIIPITIPDNVCQINVNIKSSPSDGTVWSFSADCEWLELPPEQIDIITDYYICKGDYVSGVQYFESQRVVVATAPTYCDFYNIVKNIVLLSEDIPQIKDTIGCEGSEMFIDLQVPGVITSPSNKQYQSPANIILEEGWWNAYTIDSNCSAEEDFYVNTIICNEDEIPTTFYIPTGFSPNGDGTNDLFPTYPLDFAIQIFDRWGSLMYEGAQWDGTFNGQAVKAGVYGVWIDDLNYKGSITLVR